MLKMPTETDDMNFLRGISPVQIKKKIAGKPGWEGIPDFPTQG